MISFTNMTLETFDKQHVLERLNPLKKTGLIKDISITQTKGTPSIVLLFTFSNQIAPSLIKWSKVSRSNRFVVEFYSREILDKIKTYASSAFLHASNDVIQYDVLPQAGKKKNPRPLIMLDPGHGGKNMGARGYGNLLEKDVALAITRHVRTMLKKRGYRCSLTRADDRDIELVERSQRAHDEGAQLFVSIHANSSGSRNNDAYGIETFYMENGDLLSSSKATGYLFVNSEKDASLVKQLDEQITQQAANSRNLATHIQTKILNTLDAEGLGTQDRGIKRGEFRIFLQSGMPSALVEVGFLTNKKESQLLGKHSYRKLLAQGICNGIIAHLQTAATHA